MGNSHTSSATTRNSLYDDRKTNFLGNLYGVIFIFNWTVTTWNNRNTGFCNSLPAIALSPILRMVSALGPMKLILHEAHCSANSAFSDKKPYRDELHQHQQFPQHLRFDLLEDNSLNFVQDRCKLLHQRVVHARIVHRLPNRLQAFECQALYRHEQFSRRFRPYLL